MNRCLLVHVLQLSLIATLISSCVSSPKYDEKKISGSWQAKAQIKDLKKNSQHVVSMDFIAEWPNSLRVEVAGSVGVRLASIVVSEQQIRYSIHQQKKYYEGRVSSTALYPVFQINLNPQLLLNVLFDRPIQEKDWICKNGEDDKVAKCSRVVGSPLIIEWKDRKEELKKILISGDTFEVQIAVKNFSPKVQDRTDLFALVPPPSYQKFRLK